MYNTMVKLRNKKAFTLVEMMAVIAIVAVLVAVVVPIIGKSTTKARAATNAANLRSVESELATMKVSNPECFVSAISESPGKYFAYVLDFLVGDGAGQYYLSKIEANDAGELIFKEEASGESVTLYNVPTSVAVSADTGMDVADGTKMVVYISGNDIFAAYLGTDGTVFDKDCFAEVAETGKFTGETGSPQGGAIDKLNCLLGNHKWNNGVCSVCGKVCKHESAFGESWWENGVCSECGMQCTNHNKTNDGNAETHHCTTCGTRENHTWEPDNTFSTILSALGIDSTTTGKCDCGYEHLHSYKYVALNYHYCSECGHLEPCSIDSSTGKCFGCGNGCTHRWNSTTGKCDSCGFTCQHSGWKNETSWWQETGNHECTTCGMTHTPTWSYTDKTTHSCTVDGCTMTASHTWVNGTCSVCYHACPDCEGKGETTACETCGYCNHTTHIWGSDHKCTVSSCTATHTAQWAWSTTAGDKATYHYCTVDGCPAKEKHSWKDGVCSVCQHTCQHKNDGGTWSLCGDFGTSVATGNHKCSICGKWYEHTDSNSDGKCDVCGATKKTIGWKFE